MVPALLESSYAADTWTQIHSVAAERCAQSLLDQSRLLGMAVAALGEAVHAADTTSGDRGGVSGASSANARKWRHKPRVVDLSALWAGPLCGALLAQAGCQVVKVESISRPDNSIGVGGEFSAMLNKDKISARFDFKSPHDRGELQSLLHHADIIITSAGVAAWTPADFLPNPSCNSSRPLFGSPSRVTDWPDQVLSASVLAMIAQWQADWWISVARIHPALSGMQSQTRLRVCEPPLSP